MTIAKGIVKQMAAGQFKAKCLAVMDQVLQSGEPIVITKHGKPVVKVVPAEKRVDDIFDYMAGRAKIVGDHGPDCPRRLGTQVILLDTHALYWMANESKRLSKPARDAILEARQRTGIAIATISIWELAWLAQNRRIEILGSVESYFREIVSRVSLRPITPEIAALSVNLPDDFPKDPSDRLIAATAMAEGMQLVTADARIRRAKVVETIW